MASPNVKRLPPATVGEKSRQYTVTAKFEREGEVSLRDAVLRFCETEDVLAKNLKYLEVALFATAEGNRAGWRENGMSAYAPLEEAESAPGIASGGNAWSLIPSTNSTTPNVAVVSVIGSVATLRINDSLVGKMTSDMWKEMTYVAAYPDTDGDYPLNEFPSPILPVGILTAFDVFAPIPPAAWTLLGIAGGAVLLASILAGVSMKKNN